LLVQIHAASQKVITVNTSDMDPVTYVLHYLEFKNYIHTQAIQAIHNYTLCNLDSPANSMFLYADTQLLPSPERSENKHDLLCFFMHEMWCT